MSLTEAQKRAKEKYRKKTHKVTVEFYPQEQDLINKLQEQPSKQGYIKELIKKDLQ
jgi:DNA-binding protein H-NS